MQVVYISILILFVCTTSVFSQGKGNLPETFTLSNHGKDYPQKDSYFFGLPANNQENKGIAIDDEPVAKLPTHNGLIVFTLSKDSLANGKYHSFTRNNDIRELNGMYYFDYMLTETAVDQTVVDSLAAFLANIPDNYLLFVFSGYYHQVELLGEPVYRQFERFGSKKIRVIENDEVWVFYGSNCNEDHNAVELNSENQAEVLTTTVKANTSCLSTAINNTELFNLSIFPNPSNGLINIESLAEKVAIKIYDLQGALHYTADLNSNVQVKLSPGIYFIEAIKNNAVYTDKLIVY